jgi:hypothetical protein
MKKFIYVALLSVLSFSNNAFPKQKNRKKAVQVAKRKATVRQQQVRRNTPVSKKTTPARRTTPVTRTVPVKKNNVSQTRQAKPTRQAPVAKRVVQKVQPQRRGTQTTKRKVTPVAVRPTRPAQVKRAIQKRTPAQQTRQVVQSRPVRYQAPVLVQKNQNTKVQPKKVVPTQNKVNTQQNLGLTPSVTQLTVVRQKALSCGYWSVFNLLAVQNCIQDGTPVTAQNVQRIAKMYIDGYLLERGITENEVTIMAPDEELMQLGRDGGLNNFFILHYMPESHELVRKRIEPAGLNFIYNSERNRSYDCDTIGRSKQDLKNSIRNNQVTSCILLVPGHFVAFSIVKDDQGQPRILFMNSTNGAMDSGARKFADHLKGLIS